MRGQQSSITSGFAGGYLFAPNSMSPEGTPRCRKIGLVWQKFTRQPESRKEQSAPQAWTMTATEKVHEAMRVEHSASVGPVRLLPHSREDSYAHPDASSHAAAEISRRALLQRGLTAGLAVGGVPLARPPHSGGRTRSHQAWGILRVRGLTPCPSITTSPTNAKTNTTLSFVHSTLLRFKVGPEIPPAHTQSSRIWRGLGEPEDLTSCPLARRGIKWHNKPPLNGAEPGRRRCEVHLDRFLHERPMCSATPGVRRPGLRWSIAIRVKFVLKEPLSGWAPPGEPRRGCGSLRPKVVQKFGDLKEPEIAMGPGPFLLERYEPNIKRSSAQPGVFLAGQRLWTGGVARPRGRIDGVAMFAPDR